MLCLVLICVCATQIADGCSPKWTRESMWSRYQAQMAGAGQGGRGGRKIGFDKSSTSWNVLGVSKPSGNSVDIDNAFKTGRVNKKLPHHGTFQASQSPLAIQLLTLKTLSKQVG